MILLDTSVFYTIAGIDKHNIDLNKLTQILKNDDFVICPTTLFELLNNNLHKQNFSFIIGKTQEMCHQLNYFPTKQFSEVYSTFDANNLPFGDENKLNEIRLKLGNIITKRYAWYFAYVITIALTINLKLLFLPKEIDKNIENEINKNILILQSNINKKIYTVLRTRFNELLIKYEFTLKNIKNDLINLYCNYCAYYLDDYRKLSWKLDNNEYILISKAFEPFLKISSSKNITKSIFRKAHIDFNSLTLTKAFDCPSNKVDKYLDNIINLFVNDSIFNNSIYTKIMKNYILKFIKGQPNLNPNDIPDSDIAFMLQNKYINSVLSFDIGFRKRIKEAEEFIDVFKYSKRYWDILNLKY